MDQNLYLLHFFIILGLSFLSLRFSYKILTQKLFFTKTLNLSPLIIVYFVIIFFQSIFSILLYAYSIIFWRPDTVIYDGRILFILGLSCGFFLFLHPIIEILLCIDRCFTVIFPITYKLKFKFQSFVTAMAFLSVISIAVIIQVCIINTFPLTSTTSCRVYYCIGFFLSQRYSMIVKIIIASTSLFCSTILGIIINKYLSHASTSATQRMNKTLVIMVIATVCLDFLPNLIGQIFQNVTQMNLLDFIGPYTLICGTLNVTLCSGMYYRALKATIVPSVVVATVTPWKNT